MLMLDPCVDAANIGGDGRKTREHGLADSDSKRLRPDRRRHRDVGGSIELAHPLGYDVADELDREPRVCALGARGELAAPLLITGISTGPGCPESQGDPDRAKLPQRLERDV